jgi:peroxiredoxin
MENIGLSGISTLDSAKLNATGSFSFKHKKPVYPDFYRLRLNNKMINFAVDSTETISIVADAGTFATSYTIEGSENSKAIKVITLAQLDANIAIGKLRNEHESNLIPDTAYGAQLVKIAAAYKEIARQYIYAAPMSTAAYFALFQKVDGLLFFDLYDKDDSKAFGAVATSFDHYYPKNERTLHLHNLALQSIKVIRQQRAMTSETKTNIEEISYLDISLPNMDGSKVSLSSIAAGKVVLINFTAYQTEWSPALNMDLSEIYERNKDKGFEIYQVSLDSDMHFWKNVSSRIPWICVRDPESVYSQIAALYNVRQLPAIFLLDKKGNLVKRIEDLASLEADVKKLL